MTEQTLTCIVCPKGCRITVTADGNNIVSVSGNTCPRGEEYAVQECIAPRRVVTSTVRCSDGSVVPVKTNGTIPKECIAEWMKQINQTVVGLPISIGDVIIEDLFGCSVIATDTKKE